jgi:hypothetical protein
LQRPVCVNYYVMRPLSRIGVEVFATPRVCKLLRNAGPSQGMACRCLQRPVCILRRNAGPSQGMALRCFKGLGVMGMSNEASICFTKSMASCTCAHHTQYSVCVCVCVFVCPCVPHCPTDSGSLHVRGCFGLGLWHTFNQLTRLWPAHSSGITCMVIGLYGHIHTRVHKTICTVM